MAAMGLYSTILHHIALLDFAEGPFIVVSFQLRTKFIVISHVIQPSPWTIYFLAVTRTQLDVPEPTDVSRCAILNNPSIMMLWPAWQKECLGIYQVMGVVN
jgi:hypothetical protein